MGHLVTLGGERVGAGSKSKVYLRNYERSTHNLSYDWLSTMGCGMLIPFMCELVTRDDKYEINLQAGLRTIPTKGPLFGSFKLQLDVYQCPLRLYQALLHNNPLAIGLKANQVKFPKIRLYDTCKANTIKESKAANNSLIKYLGISGMGTIENTENVDYIAHRDLFGAGVLAYYDIFKNYYANKQEENAYTLGNRTIGKPKYNISYYQTELWSSVYGKTYEVSSNSIDTEIDGKDYLVVSAPEDIAEQESVLNCRYIFLLQDNEEFPTIEEIKKNRFAVTYSLPQSQVYRTPGTLDGLKESGYIDSWEYDTNNKILYVILPTYLGAEKGYITSFEAPAKIQTFEEEMLLNAFQLSLIDDMRYDILSFHGLGESFVIDGDNIGAPYFDALGNTIDYNWKNSLAGICVKTYQSDIFNNWLNTETIDGDNGISAITAISTSSGSITIDQLQFSEKLYNLLNRIAVSGGTYQDYLDAAYTASAKRFEESPMWIGGMSDEVVFEEIVQTAPAGDGILGTLGGRGNLMGEPKGGKITVKIDEPSLLIGIVSLTPRIVQTQGNKWFNTEIDSLQDIHVPALDAIGFQNLIAETMHFGSTIIDANDSSIQERPIIGKIPAWLHYMTNYDQAYGDFAATDGDGYMVLNRNYECVDGILQDATTYIDPAKFNYAFGYTKRDAQNFWVKIKCKIKARRLMSAKQIPTA